MNDAIKSAEQLRSDRFEIQGRLGGGSFGEVFRVHDRQLKTVVALKILHRVEPAALYHFKKEFRALAGVHHRNLVQLYELLSTEDRWFFTMELVEGRDFISYAGLNGARSTLDMLEYSGVKPLGSTSLRRLRGASKQLAEGLSALHRAGRLHRDIKPANIKVTPEGRLVLLDFGLVKELLVAEAFETSAGEVLGTPAYMAPEQAIGGPVTEASDWYAVGCVLYEALTGQPPFSGSLPEIMKAKQTRRPPAPSDLDSSLPEDLCVLCHQLMTLEPSRRPSAEEVLERLGGTEDLPAPPAGFARIQGADVPFVGREKELEALHRRFEQARRGQAVAVFVHGSSGLGKTALVDRFVSGLRQRHPEIVVLAGRCYERESVPYKGLDPLIDTLSGYLKQLPTEDAEALMPKDVWALARLFPALERVPAVSRAGREVLELPDPREQRRQARRALRELLRHLGEKYPTVLYIDDLQWSDRDSANLLAHVFGSSVPPSVLLLACDRRGENDERRLLQHLLVPGRSDESIEVHEIEVGRLSFQQISELGRQLLGERSRIPQRLIPALARESGGSPFFMNELVRYAQSELESEPDSSSLDLGVIPLENLIWNRIEQLPLAARYLMDVIAVAGRPVSFRVAIEAADLGRDAQAAVTDLLAANLACLRGDRQQELECYHDRIRETTVQGLDPARLEQLHQQLATALQASGRADAETLTMHFYAAGDRVRAAELAVTAARRASAALAFDRAARLYRLALELEPADLGEQQQLQVALADSLARVGRVPEAAEAYLHAAAGAQGTAALELKRRAAVQHFLSGHARTAFTMIRRLLLETDIRLPRSTPEVLWSFFMRRIYLKLRGFGFKERQASQISQRQLFRIDACWSGSATVEPLRWLELATRHLLLALEAGEPRRIVRAMLYEVFYLARGGKRTRRRRAELIQLASRLAKRIDDPYSLGLAKQAAALAAFFDGRWKRAGELLERTEALLREGLVDWELAWVILWRMEILFFRGHFAELQGRLPAVLKEVTDRGNLLLEILLRSRVAWWSRLAADEPGEASLELRRADDLLTPDLAFFRHFLPFGRVEIALYRGDVHAAWQAIEQAWPQLERSSLLQIQHEEVQARHLRCRASLAWTATLDPGSAAWRRARRGIRRGLRRIESHHLAWGDPLAQLVRAGLENQSGVDAALEFLTAAEAGFEAADMELYAAVSRRRRGELLGTVDGARYIQQADRWMLRQGIRNPARMAGVLAPGFWEVPAQLEVSPAVDSL